MGLFERSDTIMSTTILSPYTSYHTYLWAPLEVNAAGELDFVMINPSVVMDSFYQVCPSLAARVSGKVVKTLKGNFNQNSFWPFKRYCPEPEFTCNDICDANNAFGCGCGC